MFVASNQIFYFVQSCFVGVISALLYEVIRCFKVVFKSKIFGNVIDVVFAFILFIIYLDFSLWFCFPDFRFYMFFGVILGFYLENKSFHKTLAKVGFVVYNKTISFIRRKNRDGRKETKVNIGRNGVISGDVVRFNHSSCLSTYRHRGKVKTKRHATCRKN